MGRILAFIVISIAFILFWNGQQPKKESIVDLEILFGSSLVASFICVMLCRSRFTLQQAIAAALLYGIVMTAFCSKSNPPGEVLGIALVNLLLVGSGLFLGARNTRVLVERQPRLEWVIFLAGLLSPYALIALFVSVANILPDREFRVFHSLLAALIFLLSSAVLLTTFFCLLEVQIQQESKR